jgi:hypothetical protein
MPMTNLNGNRRPTLAEQIDRLDGILDGLADALNESVAAVVHETVGQAVREAVDATLTEALANSQQPARDAIPANPDSQPAAADRACPDVGGLICQARARACACEKQLKRLRGMGAHSARLGIALMMLAYHSGWCLARSGVRRVVRARWALACGVATGLGAYLAGPGLAAVASGLGGFCAALTAQSWLQTWRGSGGAFIHLAPQAGDGAQRITTSVEVMSPSTT